MRYPLRLRHVADQQAPPSGSHRWGSFALHWQRHLGLVGDLLLGICHVLYLPYVFSLISKRVSEQIAGELEQDLFWEQAFDIHVAAAAEEEEDIGDSIAGDCEAV